MCFPRFAPAVQAIIRSMRLTLTLTILAIVLGVAASNNNPIANRALAGSDPIPTCPFPGAPGCEK